VLEASASRKKTEIGERRGVVSCLLDEMFGKLFEDEHGLTTGSDSIDQLFEEVADTTKSIDDRAEAIEVLNASIARHERRAINKEMFNRWMHNEEVVDVLDTVEVDMSTRFELFDALDVDMAGEIRAEDFVPRMMLFRGPITKLDVVATRLKIRHLVKLLSLICGALGIRDPVTTE